MNISQSNKLLHGALFSFFIIFLWSVWFFDFLGIKSIFAAETPWTQTDWSGGTASGTVSTNVTTYESQSNIDTSVLGEISLEETSGWSSDYLNWGYRKTITFDNTTSNLGVTSEALTNFPVLIKLDSGSDIDYTKTKDSGEDIRFTDSDGTVLSYEIEEWNESGSSYVWVKVPQIDINSSSDYIYLYYGNSVATDGQNASGVWESSYAGVWHMNETSGSASDSTSNDITLTNRNSVDMDTTGKISGGGNFQGNGDALHNQIATITFATDLTLEGWFYRTSSGNGSGRILEFSPTGNADSHALAVDSNGSLRGWTECNNGTRVGSADDSTVYGTGTWYYYVYTYDGSVGRIYVNGAQTATSSSSCTDIADTADSIIGAISDQSGQYTLSQHEFDGNLDEHRVSTSTRSAAWIAATYKSHIDSFNSFGSEENKYPSSSTLTSNIFDAGFPADWGTLTYTTSGSGTVTVKVRSDSNSDMSGATAWASCSSISSGTDLTSTDCVTDITQYLQYQISLTASGASSPVIEDISIAFTASDQTAPTTNATSVDIVSLADSGSWTKNAPTISWTAGADNSGGIGLAGYCIALDEVAITGSESSSSLNPSTTAGSLLNAIDDGISTTSNCGYIVAGTSIDLSSIDGLTLTTGKRYYFSIKAVDLAGNVYSGASGTYQDLIDFKYDNVAPTNVSYISAPASVFGNVNDMFFSWPSSGGSVSSDADSGLLGWQYSLDAGSNWRGPDTSVSLGITYIDDDSATYSYTLNDSDDGADITEGINTIYFRTVDVAGNYSSAASYRTTPLNYGGAAPTFAIACDLTSGITVTPSTSTSNSFALSWDAATATGDSTVEGYYYMVNTSPPSSLSTLQSNSTQYIANSTTSLSTTALTGSVKGTNTVYVVAYDSDDNYSQSNCLKGTYVLNSTLPDPAKSLSASDASIKSDELWRASITWGAPSYKGTGTLTYQIQRSTDNSSWSTIATTSGTSYTDTVDSSQTYYYRIGVYDTTSESQAAPTYTSSVSIYPKGTWSEAPSISGDPTVSGITTKNATITWSTSRTADSKIQYGKGSSDYFGEEPSKSEQVTSHEISLTNLSPGTNYYYTAKWTDEDGNTGTSNEFQFTTSPAPTVTDPIVKTLGISNAVIQFTVKNSYKAKIYYGKSTSFGGSTEISTSPSESIYNVTLEGLEDGTKYFYKINTLDVENTEYEGNTLSFETLPRPQISAVRIQQVANTAESSVLVSWQTNTDVSSIITYYPENNPSQARDEVNIALQRGEHKMVVRGLQPQTNYALVVKGTDKSGNQATSDTQRFTTATDTRPPQISDLSTEGSTQILDASSQESVAQIVVSWNTDEPATSQVEFGEGAGTTYSQKTQEDSNATLNHLVVISGLTPSKVYHLRAISKDLNGNVSESVDTVTITPKATDNALDLVISNLQEAFGFIGDIRN